MRGRCHQRLVLYGSILRLDNGKLLTMAKVLTESSLFQGYCDNLLHPIRLLPDPSLLLILSH